MSDWQTTEGEQGDPDRPQADEPNPTQERMDELGESESSEPADVGWDENEPSPHEGEEGSTVA